MSPITNPALNALLAESLDGEGFVLAHVVIRRNAGAGYDLRHVVDATTPVTQLRAVKVSELRNLAQFTIAGEFRPLKSAPTLVPGWRALAADPASLESALNQLYPGALADWFTARQAVPPVTHYREFAGRQTGMYQVTATLDDRRVGEVIAATCVPTACLKRRLWTVAGMAIDPSATKSCIPCLEPCALFLDAARRAARKDSVLAVPPANALG